MTISENLFSSLIILDQIWIKIHFFKPVSGTRGSESDQIRISTTDFIIERWSRYCPMSSQWVGRVDELLTYCPASVWGGWMSWGTCSSWAPVLSPWHWSGDSCSPAYLQEHHTYNLCTKTELINHSKLSTLCCTIWWINSVYNMLSEKKY